jgi:NAD(P)-dependent dehydrogenase (short-subunit alcohol dehydrogenase family)
MATDMTGKTCLITGASSGIGLEAARVLAGLGARVLIVARDRRRGEAAQQQIAGGAESPVELLLADLGSQRQVRELAAEVGKRCDRLEVLVNNAGLTLRDLVLTEDQIETTFAVNHLAPFLLTNLLQDLLVGSAPSRVVTVASDAHRSARLDLDRIERREWTSGWTAYCESKLANILFTRELARRLQGTGVTATCLHPGVVRTGFGRQGPAFIRAFFKLAGLFLVSPEQGAETIVYLASAEEAAATSGTYFERRREKQPSAAACDDRAADRLWQVSEQLTRLG